MNMILFFLKNGSVVYNTKIFSLPINMYQFQVFNNIINLPDEVSKNGFDAIKIKLKPYADFRMAVLGHIVLY